MDNTVAPVHVGQRISHGDRHGTARYVGRLDIVGKTGLWVGVEWDQGHSGLHDGVFNGHRFFQARQSSASFIPIHNVTIGVSGKHAIWEKYGTPADSDIGVRFGSKDVVAVGWEKTMRKVCNFERLLHVDLTGLDVNDSDNDLAAVIPNVETLVLGKSLIPSWSSVIAMIRNLRKLEMLDLSDNRLLIDDTRESNSCVKKLILRRNSLSWEDVLKILPMFSSLEELFLPENNVSKLGAPPIETKLAVLDLDSQSDTFADWNEVMQIGQIMSLKVLQLSNNRLKNIFFPSGVPQDRKTACFPVLSQLAIKMNDLADWSSVNELNKLRRLENLKISPNPFMEKMSPETARQWIIAKISGLKMLNQTPITASERRDSELDYMRHFGAEWLRITAQNPVSERDKEAFLICHPRFPEILERLGPLELGEVQQTAKNQLVSSLVKVTLKFQETKQEKAIPSTISVLKLKRLAERLFRIPETQKLFYVTPEKPDVYFSLDDEQKEIAYYNIKTGDIIVIN